MDICEGSSCDSPSVQIDKELLCKVRPNTIEGPLLYQPQAFNVNRTTITVQADVLSKHIVALENHLSNVKIIRDLEGGDSSSSPTLPSIPSQEAPPLFVSLPSQCGLSRTSVSQAHRHSAMVFSRLAGFNSTSQSCVDILADLIHEFLTRATTALRTAQERQALRGSNAHIDAVNQALHDVGFTNGVLDVRDFFFNRLLAKRDSLLDECKQVHLEHEAELYSKCEMELSEPRSIAGIDEITEECASFDPLLLQ